MNVYNLGLNAKNQESFVQFSGLGRHFSLSPSLRPLNFEMLDKFSAFYTTTFTFLYWKALNWNVSKLSFINIASLIDISNINDVPWPPTLYSSLFLASDNRIINILNSFLVVWHRALNPGEYKVINQFCCLHDQNDALSLILIKGQPVPNNILGALVRVVLPPLVQLELDDGALREQGVSSTEQHPRKHKTRLTNKVSHFRRLCEGERWRWRDRLGR